MPLIVILVDPVKRNPIILGHPDGLRVLLIGLRARPSAQAQGGLDLLRETFEVGNWALELLMLLLVAF